MVTFTFMFTFASPVSFPHTACQLPLRLVLIPSLPTQPALLLLASMHDMPGYGGYGLYFVHMFTG
jgi:hypothetical protein